jgi:hypothetical protein
MAIEGNGDTKNPKITKKKGKTGKSFLTMGSRSGITGSQEMKWQT